MRFRRGVVWAALATFILSVAAEAGPVKTVAGLQTVSETWDTYMGCLRGCLQYLHSDITPAWLFGVSGHAFGLNIHKQLCPSGPHVWSGWGSLQGHEALLGLEVERVGPWYKGYDDQYAAHRQLAWERTRKAIDAGTPCIGYDLSWGEFYVVNGYDDAGYLYWNTNYGQLKQGGPLAWDEYGDGGVVHMIAMQFVSLGAPPAAPREVVKAALQWAVRFGARGDADDPHRNAAYASGLAAYDQWIAALDDPECWKGDCSGAMYNGEVWRECRHYAVEFLKEAKHRVGDDNLAPLFDEAIRHYERVEAKLGVECEQFGIDSPAKAAPQAERSQKAQRALREAKYAEDSGLKALARLTAAL
jgi:hypothetical protein